MPQKKGLVLSVGEQRRHADTHTHTNTHIYTYTHTHTGSCGGQHWENDEVWLMPELGKRIILLSSTPSRGNRVEFKGKARPDFSM